MSYELHEPSFEGISDQTSDNPRDDDFNNLATASDHFLLSETGFPPERFDDLHLPVVDNDGKLNFNKLRTAKGTVEQIDDIDEDMIADTKEKIDDLIDENFQTASL